MKYTLIALVFTLFISCKQDDAEVTVPTETIDYVAKNDQEITDYIAKNKLTATKTDTGLYYVINEAGIGVNPTASSKVTVAYKGYFTNGTTFDQSDASGISFGLNQVIKGWTEGIPYFKEGGTGVLLIPSHLGYGSNATGPIPGNSVLVFDIKLIKVN